MTSPLALLAYTDLFGAAMISPNCGQRFRAIGWIDLDKFISTPHKQDFTSIEAGWQTVCKPIFNFGLRVNDNQPAVSPKSKLYGAGKRSEPNASSTSINNGDVVAIRAAAPSNDRVVCGKVRAFGRSFAKSSAVGTRAGRDAKVDARRSAAIVVCDRIIAEFRLPFLPGGTNL